VDEAEPHAVQQEAKDDDGVDDMVVAHTIEDDAAIDSPVHGAADEESTPTGADSSSQTPDEPPVPAAPAKPAVPQRAHPPPAAPVEAFPPWATVPPVRKPRHVTGMDAKYVLKPTQEAFNHPSLSAHQAVVDGPGFGAAPAADSR